MATTRAPADKSSTVLRLDATDALALQTKIQLLVALDRYPEALALLDADEDRLTQAYCLYKTGREGEAQEAVAQLDEEEGEDRAAKLLEAQVVCLECHGSRSVPLMLFNTCRATAWRITRLVATSSRTLRRPSTT